MLLNSINFCSQNVAGQQFKNNLLARNNFVNFGHRYTADEVAFSKPRSDKRETVDELLRNARIGNKHRFSLEEKFNLARDLRSFHSTIPTAKILNRLLNMEYSNGNKLTVADIASYFSVMNGGTKTQIKASLELMEHYLNEGYAQNSEELDNIMFLPLENNPDLIKHLGNSTVTLKDLPTEDRAALMHYTLDIVEDSDYKYNSYFPQIIKTIAQDKSGFAYRILLDAAAKVKSVDEEGFKNLLKSFTPEKFNQINSEVLSLGSSTAEQGYIDEYINSFTK